MQATESDWVKRGIGILLRWAVLLALGLLLALRGFSFFMLPLLLGIGGLYNAVFSFTWLSDNPIPGQDRLAVYFDIALAALLFFFSRTLTGPLVWAGLLPVISAAWTFSLVGGFVAALSLSLSFALLSVIDVRPLTQIPMQMFFPGFVFLALAAFFGIAGPLVQQSLGEINLKHRAERQRQEGKQATTVYEMVTAFDASLDFNKMLDLALDLNIGSLTEAHETVSRAVGGILLFGESGLQLAATRGLAGQDQGRILPGEKGALAELLREGKGIALAQPGQDPEFRLVAGLQNCTSLYCSALRSGVDLLGALFLAHPEPNFFTVERRQLIDVISNQVALVLQNGQLVEELNAEKKRNLHIQEQTSRQLARALHDGPTQAMAALAMRINLARRLLSTDPALAGEELGKVEDLARSTTREIRLMLFTLRPQILESSGLAAALKDLASQVGETYGQKIQVQVEAAAVTELAPEQQGLIFNIAAEALSNACKHAQAKNILLGLSRAKPDMALLEVEDDGQGFDAGDEQAKRENKNALGLSTLRERVEMIHGRIELESRPGLGTRLSVWVPLSAQGHATEWGK